MIPENSIDLNIRSDRDLKTELVDIIDEKCTFLQQEGYCVIFSVNTVSIGKYIDRTFRFRENIDFTGKYMNQLRIFNKAGEIYFWKDHRCHLQYRIRDDSFDTTNKMKCDQYLWGRVTLLPNENDWVLLKENRGITFAMPKISTIQENERVLLETYQYIGYHPTTFQAGFVDCRFVDFIKG